MASAGGPTTFAAPPDAPADDPAPPTFEVLGESAVHGASSVERIVLLDPGADAAAVTAAIRARGGSVTDQFGDEAGEAPVVLRTVVPIAAAAGLAGVDGVAAAEANVSVHAADAPPWNLDRIDQRGPVSLGDSLFAPEGTGAGVKIYVIDSGLRLDHTEFTGRVAPGAYWDFGDGTQESDCDGHGTHVAGTAAGAIHGVARGATVVPVKVLDCSGSGDTESVLAGIAWVIGNHTAGQPAVANLSLGGAASGILDAYVQAMVDDGITVTVAAGNDAVNSCGGSPARVASAITVAASTLDDDDADFSNFGPCNDLFAPGELIVSAGIASPIATETMSGTSMASPHVAGAAALVLGAHPTASPTTVWAAIDAATTKGALTECCGDPDKLLYVGPGSTALAPAAFGSIAPARLLDTRPGETTIDGQFAGAGALAGGTPMVLPVVGRGNVPTGAAAVALNVTAIGPVADGFVTVYPCDQPRPTTSNLNFSAGQTVPNAAVAALTAGSGTICLFSNVTTDLVVDVDAWFPAGSIGAIAPARLLDTRPGQPTVDGFDAGIGARNAGEITEIAVAGRGNVPVNAVAVALNITATGPLADGFVTVFPCDRAQPATSNLNVRAAQTVANAATVALTAGSGTICLFTQVPMHLIVDVGAWFPASTIGAIAPARLLDTRSGERTVDGESQGIGARPGGVVTELVVRGRGNVPADATAVALNVTVTGPGGDGFVTVFPCDRTQPTTSNLNFRAGQTVPNAVVTSLSAANGSVCLYSNVTTELIVDVGAWF